MKVELQKPATGLKVNGLRVPIVHKLPQRWAREVFQNDARGVEIAMFFVWVGYDEGITFGVIFEALEPVSRLRLDFTARLVQQRGQNVGQLVDAAIKDTFKDLISGVVCAN